MMHGIVNAMGILAGEEDAPPTTTAELTGDRLGELIESNPSITEGRLAELSRLAREELHGQSDPSDGGVPSDRGSGHEG